MGGWPERLAAKGSLSPSAPRELRERPGKVIFRSWWCTTKRGGRREKVRVQAGPAHPDLLPLEIVLWLGDDIDDLPGFRTGAPLRLVGGRATGTRG